MSPRDRRTVKVAKALADPARFGLLRAIAAHDGISCAELVARAGLSQATVSHHLKILVEAGLISVRRSGPYHYHRVLGAAVEAHGEALRAAFAAPPPPGRPQPARRRPPQRKEPHPMKRIALALVLALAAAPALAAPTTYKIDPAHTHASFTVRHLVITNVRGEFGKTEGTLVYDEADPTKSSVEATIDVTSIDTREEKRDADLKSANFFDVAKHPKMTFKSTKVERAGDGKLKVTGDLTIKGTTKSVVLDVTGPTQEIKDPWGNTRRGVSATTKINRQDFGVSWSKLIEAGPVVGDEVAIEIESEVLKQAAK